MLPAQDIHIYLERASFLGVPVDVISIAVIAPIGIAQLIVIFRGLGQVKRASQERGDQLARQAIDSERRHEQAMMALRAMFERMNSRLPQPSAG